MKQSISTLVCVVLLVSAAVAGPDAAELKTPPGCRPVEGTAAEPYSATGYARDVVHEKSGIALLFVPAGEFRMGGRRSVVQAPPHTVRIARPLYVGKYEVTNAQFKRFTEATGYDGKADSDSFYYHFLKHFRGESIMPTGDDFPVVWVNWNHAVAYCKWAGLRLPSEAEWEHACRAGTTTAFSFGNDEADFVKNGWCTDNGEGSTHEAGQKPANNWGLHDMHGNVWEWCQDDMIFGYKDAPDDGAPRIQGRMTKVLRGGAWSNTKKAYLAGSEGRFNSGPTNASNDVGFRVILEVEQEPQDRHTQGSNE